MYDVPRLYVVYNGSERMRAIEDIRGLRLGTHKVLIAPIAAEDKLKWKFQAMARDIARQAKFGGAMLPAQQWRVLLKSGHATAVGEATELVSGLEGEFLDIVQPTDQLSADKLSSLISYTQAWGDLQSMQWTHPSNR
jgi:hypothetical protein